MQQLNRTIKLKLMLPFAYFGMLIVFLILTWPTTPQTHHLVGAALAVVAFIFWIIARIQLGNAFTITPDAKFIVKEGIYSKLRHPVYYFSILAGVGITLYWWQWPWLVIMAVFVLLQIFRISKEEAMLSSRFGQEYLKYKKSTWF